MLSLWMLDDALTLDAQTAPHGSSDPSSTDAFRREKSCSDVLVKAPRSKIRKSNIQKKRGLLKIISKIEETSAFQALDLGSWTLEWTRLA